MDLNGRHFLKLLDYTPEEISYLLDLSAQLKDKKKKASSSISTSAALLLFFFFKL